MGEDVGRGGFGGPDHVGIHPQGDGRVGVAQAGRDHVHGYPGQQQSGRVPPGEAGAPVPPAAPRAELGVV